jgi:rare lipoprotein A
MNAPERMETPRPLLDVLKRKLVTNAPLAGPAMPTPKPGITPVADPDAAAKPAAPQPVTPAEPVATPAPKPEPAAAAPQQAGNIVVQVAAFSTHERATRAAASFESAFVVKAGRFWRLQLGKFASTSAAQAALAKAKAAGYSDARIQRTAD